MEDENAFMERLAKQQEDKKEAFENREEVKKLDMKPSILYQLTVTKAWGKQDEKYGDWMAIAFDVSSPVTKKFKGDGENTIFLRGGLMRTFRQRILRDAEDNEKYPELESGVINGEPVVVKVPNIIKPTNIQFVIEEAAPSGTNSRGFLQAWGEVVETFPKFEAVDGFVNRIKTERTEYLNSRKNQSEDDDGKKLGAKELGTNKIVHVHLTRAFAPKDENPNYMIFHIDTKKSKLWSGYEAGKDEKYNRLHLSGLTLKTFVKNVLKDVPAKENGATVQVAFNADKQQPEVVAVPLIPEGGISVRFFRRERKSANFAYMECLGEVVKE